MEPEMQENGSTAEGVDSSHSSKGTTTRAAGECGAKPLPALKDNVKRYKGLVGGLASQSSLSALVLGRIRITKVAEQKSSGPVCLVTITPEVSSRTVNRSIIAELVRLYKDSDLGMRLPASDGRKSLYTAGQLPYSWKDFMIKLIDDEDGLNYPNTQYLANASLKKNVKGTSWPAHYHALWDEKKFTADGIQSLTNNLCYTFARCTRSFLQHTMEPEMQENGSTADGGNPSHSSKGTTRTAGECGVKPLREC
ncbi:hypothetical protein KIW84_065523 [Lathyrus oleraceus]|uniref:Uncharacterized protein n=1 Tax=Pisum sativum TaxID=3888 RepID=A0A9D4WFP6_PEA|nr:hypothetical protein KIW84_065523 [Pisum sativum]